MSESHLKVETVGETDVIEEVGTQFWRKKPVTECTLAATLLTDEYRHTLVAMQCVHLQPMCHHRAKPDAEISLHLVAHSRQTIEEARHMVAAVPLANAVEIVGDRVVVTHSHRVEIFLDDFARRTVASHAFLSRLDYDSVQHLVGKGSPYVLILKAHFQLAVDNVTAKLEAFLKECFHFEHKVLTLGYLHHVRS